MYKHRDYNMNLADERPHLIVRKYLRPVKGRKQKELVLRAFIGAEKEIGNYTGPSYCAYPIQDRREQYDANKTTTRNACWVSGRLIRLSDGMDITPVESRNAS